VWIQFDLRGGGADFFRFLFVDRDAVALAPPAGSALYGLEVAAKAARSGLWS
jgi:hypothetical protein